MSDFLREIILVEDNEMHAELFLRNFCKVSNQKVRWFKDSDQTKRYFQDLASVQGQSGRLQSPFVIVDIKLPDEDGLLLISFLTEKYEKSSEEFIVLTSSLDKDEARRAKELGVGLFMTKPIVFGGYPKSISKILNFVCA